MLFINFLDSDKEVINQSLLRHSQVKNNLVTFDTKPH